MRDVEELGNKRWNAYCATDQKIFMGIFGLFRGRRVGKLAAHLITFAANRPPELPLPEDKRPLRKAVYCRLAGAYSGAFHCRFQVEQLEFLSEVRESGCRGISEKSRE